MVLAQKWLLASSLQINLNLQICSFTPPGSRGIRNCQFAWRNQHRSNVKSGTGSRDAKRKLGILVLKRMPALCNPNTADCKPALEITLVLTPQAVANLLRALTSSVLPTVETQQLQFTYYRFPVPTLLPMCARRRASPCAECSPSLVGQFCNQDSSCSPFSRFAVS